MHDRGKKKVSVCVYVSVECVRVCVSVSERESERGREKTMERPGVMVASDAYDGVCVCVRER